MGGYKLDFPSWLSFTPLKQICTNYLCTIGPLMLFNMLVKWFPKQIICYVNMNIKWIIGIGIIQISLLLFKATLHLYFFSFNLKSCTIELFYYVLFANTISLYSKATISIVWFCSTKIIVNHVFLVFYNHSKCIVVIPL